jgi:hypothetical protein
MKICQVYFQLLGFQTVCCNQGNDRKFSHYQPSYFQKPTPFLWLDLPHLYYKKGKGETAVMGPVRDSCARSLEIEADST